MRNHINNASISHNDLQPFFRFKLDSFNSINDSKLLSYESNLQQLLSLSNIFIIGKNTYDEKLDGYFTETTIHRTRQNIFDGLNYNLAERNMPKEMVVDLIYIANDLNSGALTKVNAIKKNINLIADDDMDPILARLLFCFKAFVGTLPKNTQQKRVKENELCTRYLQPFFQSLFDSSEYNNMTFKWTNTITFSSNNNDDTSTTTKNRPDGCIENDRKTIGFVEVRTVDNAANHHKINVDLYRLGVFGKTTLSKYDLKKTFQVMAIGTNLHFYICQNIDGICVMSELANLKFPMSLDELPQVVPYFDRLYQVLKTIYLKCYSKENVSTTTGTDKDTRGDTLEPKVLKAITEKTVDRTRYNCFYHSYY